MLAQIISIVNFVLILKCDILVQAAHMPSFLKACSKSDPDLFQCEHNSGVEAIPHLIHGYPKFKIPDISPFHVSQLEVDLTPELHLNLKNGSLYGAETAQIHIVHLDPSTNQGYVTARIPVVTLEGEYAAKGQLMMLPINGEGELNITIVDADVTFSLEWTIAKRKGVDYGRITNHSVSLDFAGGSCQLTNLFNDNPQLGEAADTLMRDNFKDIFLELKPSVEQIVSYIINSIASKLFKNVPYNELFLE